jgi:hypothetical protein
MQRAMVNMLTTIAFLLMGTVTRTDAWGRDTSLRCVYDLLVGARESIALCHYDIDAEKDRRFAEVRANVKKFINKNVGTGGRKIDDDYDKDIRSGLERSVAYCRSIDYVAIRSWFLEAMSAEWIAAINKRLETPSDPDEGDCL